MNTTNHSIRLTFIGVALFFILACNLFAPQPVAPVQVVTVIVPATSEQPFIIPSPSSTFLSSPLPISPSTFTATFAPTFSPTFTATNTITNTPTNTPLPSLPNFDTVITFGSGGAGGPGGWPCNYQKKPNTIQADAHFGDSAELCILLQGVNYGQPFQLTLNQPGKSAKLLSSKFWFDSKNKKIRWEGYPNARFGYSTSGNKTYIQISISWPIKLLPGKWEITFSQEKFRITETFLVSKAGDGRYIDALDSKVDSEIIPAVEPHSVRATSAGKIDVLGTGFPENIPVYVLLYRQTSPSDPYTYGLIQKQAIMSDVSGAISAELTNLFVPGQVYVVYGITDPNARLNGSSPDKYGCFHGVSCDFFTIAPSTSSSELPDSCPGAPPQRMTVNQRGYVCTRSDPVRLRSAPARSASTLTQIVPGTQFTVIGGPSCSDNWSWWNVRMENGTTGWVSEGGDEIDPYFICPLP